MANGRCRMHGGPSTGPKDQKTRPNALKHGLYSTAIRPEERELYDRCAEHSGSLDSELALARLRLYRLVKLSGDATLQSLVDGAIEVANKAGTDMQGMPFDKSEITAKAPEYGAQIVTALNAVMRLELARHELTKDGVGKDDAQEPIGKIVVEVFSAGSSPPDD